MGQIGKRAGALRALAVALVSAAVSVLVVPASPAGAATTFEVNSTNDVLDGVCDPTHCSLRDAITASNADVAHDTITFDLPSATIQVSTQLPTITQPVTIDGRSQAGYAGLPVVELDGQLTPISSVGLNVTADGVTIQGLVINRFGARGIAFDGADDAIVRGNHVGTDVAGDVDLGRMGFAGVSLTNSADAVVGGTGAGDRNILTGAFALEIGGTGATGNLAIGNYLGVRISGAGRLGTRAGGLRLWNGASSNTVGGDTPGERNVGYGMTISSAATTGNTIIGNYIGLNPAGTAVLCATCSSVGVNDAHDNRIGGGAPGEGNLVAGQGISIGGALASGNVVQGNRIGVNAAGTATLLVNDRGIGVGSPNTVVGGSDPGEGNVIGGTTNEGILVVNTPDGSVIEGNRIGVDATGTVALPNQRHGIHVAQGSGVTIGGDLPAEWNTIANNGQHGIAIWRLQPPNTPPSGISVLGNSIHSNGWLGIDFGENGPTPNQVTPNDAGDVDVGQNGLQNFPVLSGVRTTGNTLRVTGSLDTTAGTYFLQMYANAACDDQGHGQGQRYLGSISVVVAGPGGTPFGAVLRTRVPPGEAIAATATSPTGSTSEFSACATAVNLATVANFDGDIDTDVTVWRPSEGAWYRLGADVVWWGLPGDIPVPADYDGDGAADEAVYRSGAWHVQGSSTAFFGLDGDIPVPGDYDADGTWTRAVYRAGAWHVDGGPTVYLGLDSDVPVPGDYDGDGDTDRAVFRGGQWYVEGQPTVFFGLPGDIPVPGDYDGDGDADRAVFRDGEWHIDGSPTVFFGLPGDIPVPGDYDGDGDTDRAVFRDGEWHIDGSPTVFLGLPGDIPAPLPHAILREL